MTVEYPAIRTEPDNDVFYHIYRRDFNIQRTQLLPSRLSKRMKFTPGFLNHKGEFLDEKEALKEAKKCNQVKGIYFYVKDKLLPVHLK